MATTTDTRKTYAWQQTRLRILKRDQNICAYCGGHANSVDHIHPVNHGGTDDDTNLVACCTPCNSSKKDKIDQRTNWFNKNYLTKI